VNAQIRYYLKTDPHAMTDDEWAEAWQDLVWIRKEEAKKN